MRKYADWIVGAALLILTFAVTEDTFVPAMLIVIWIGIVEAYRNRKKIKRWLSD